VNLTILRKSLNGLRSLTFRKISAVSKLSLKEPIDRLRLIAAMSVVKELQALASRFDENIKFKPIFMKAIGLMIY
jgi:hypothetical protein